jgi:hypothetical protein
MTDPHSATTKHFASRTISSENRCQTEMKTKRGVRPGTIHRAAQIESFYVVECQRAGYDIELRGIEAAILDRAVEKRDSRLVLVRAGEHLCRDVHADHPACALIACVAAQVPETAS